MIFASKTDSVSAYSSLRKFAESCSEVGSMPDLRARGPEFDTRSSHILCAGSRRADVSYWLKYLHTVLVSHLGLSLPRKSVVRLTDHPYMILDYCGSKTTTIPI